MASAFEVVAKDITASSEEQLVELCNLLIWEDAMSAHMPSERVKITLRIHDPDGGIDAFTDNLGPAVRFVLDGLTVWQFKKRWPRSLARFKKELEGARAAQEQFEKGAGYTLVVGQSMAANRQLEREKTIEEIARSVGCTGPVRVFFADQVARWATNVPATLFMLGRPIFGYQRADVMLESEEHATQFNPDPQREATIDALRRTMFSAAPTTFRARVTGKAGVGKTRLVLETVKAQGLDGVSLYGQEVTIELFNWVAANPHIELTLIVDESDDGESKRYEQWAEAARGRLRLITVGHGAPHGQNVYALDPLDEKAMERVLKAATPLLDDSQIRWIAEKTRGYVKLALPVAFCLARGMTEINAMPTDRDVQEVVSRLIVADKEEMDALRGASLLTRIGWESDVAVEGQAVARFVGIEWNRMQMLVARLQQQGIVIAKGRYRYVSPELLAQWQAAEVWRGQSHRIGELLDQLPNEASKTALLERLAELGDVPGVRDALEVLLGPGGPFRTIDDLDSARASRLFFIVSGGAPDAGIGTLTRLLLPASDERLLGFAPGRRNVVWALERLAERKETFADAARILLRLAEAENESFGNNATGVLNSLLLTFLAPTEVDAVGRFRIIEEALQSNSEKRRIVALEAVGAALQDSELGLPIGSRSDVPRPHWRPRTNQEVWDVKRRGLELVAGGFRDDSPDVRRVARNVFIHHARSLVRFGLTEDVTSWFEQIQGESDAERRDIWEAIGGVVKWEDESLTDEAKKRLEDCALAIYGENLPDRIKRYTGSFASVDWPGEDETTERPEEIARQLAEDAVHSMGEVAAIVPWLFSGEAEAVWPFAYRLGQLDAERKWFDSLFEAAKVASDTRMLSGYLHGRSNAGDSAWVERLLDSWAADADLARLAVDATARSGPSDSSARRTIGMVEAGHLSPANLTWLAWGRWAEDVSRPLLVRLLRLLLRDASPTSIEAALSVLDDALPKQDAPRDLVRLSWQVIESPSAWGQSRMIPYYAARVASRLVELNPARMARLIVRMYTQGQPAYRDGRLPLIRRALELNPREVWKVIGSALLRSGVFRLSIALEQLNLIDAVDLDVLGEWLAAHGVKGARMVAHAVKPEGAQLSEVACLLLTKQGDAVGGVLAANFTSGVWWGSEVTYLEQKSATAKQWRDDPEPAVRQWVEMLLASMRERMIHAKTREEEDELT